MNVLVTGGAGFIGSRLVAALLAAGHRVRVLDDLSSGSLENLRTAAPEAGYEMVIGDVADEILLENAVADVDTVVHLAASVGVGTIHRRASASIRNNLLGSEAVIAAAAARGAHLVYASSSEVYGKDCTPPFREDADLHLGPTSVHRWSYAATKALGEWSALAHHRETAFPLTVTRFFNTVGPGQRADQGMVLPTFVARALAGLPLELHDGGRQTRCFAHVEDVAAILRGLVETPPAEPRILNLGSDEEVSIRELAQRVVRAAGSAADITDIDPRTRFGRDFEDTPRRVPCLAALHRAIEVPKMRPLDAIISDMIERARISRASASARTTETE